MIDLTGKLLGDISSVGGSRNTALSGHVSRYDGLVLECDGFPVSVGSVCDVETASGETVKAEVIGYSEGRNQLVLYEQGARIHAGVRVSLSDEGIDIDAGDAYLGRVVDALGLPLDGLPPPIGAHKLPLQGRMLNPLSRGGTLGMTKLPVTELRPGTGVSVQTSYTSTAPVMLSRRSGSDALNSQLGAPLMASTAHKLFSRGFPHTCCANTLAPMYSYFR